jgi:hypothetical protein
MLNYGSGQTNGGLPLPVTALTAGTAQTLHTAPAGSATPNVVQINAINIDQGAPGVPATGHMLTVQIVDSTGLVIRTLQQQIPVESGMFEVLDGGRRIVLNGTCAVKVFADVAGVILVTAIVDDQSSVAGAVSQNIASGLVAAVQNASRFAIGAQGGTGQATEANAQIAISRTGTIRNLGAKASAAVGGGATVTVTVRKNGADTAQTLTLANADGTGWKQTTGATISVVAGDLITISVATDNAGAPAANISAAFEFV